MLQRSRYQRAMNGEFRCTSHRGEPDREPMLGLGRELVEENSVGYGASWGGYSPPWPGRHMCPGGFFGGNPHPLSLVEKVPVYSLDGGPFLTTKFNSSLSWEWAGSGAGVGNPKIRRPRHRPNSGAGRGNGPAAHQFWGPGCPVTNT